MALLKDDLEALRRVPFFASVEPRRLKLLVFAAPRLSYEKGDTLYSEGEAGDSAFVIMHGSVEILLGVDGKEVRIATLGRYDIVGETSLLNDQARGATVRATSELDVLKIKKAQFSDLLRNSPDMGLCIMKTLSEKLSTIAQEYAKLKSKVEAA